MDACSIDPNNLLTEDDLLIAFELAKRVLANPDIAVPLLEEMDVTDEEAQETLGRLTAVVDEIRFRPVEFPAQERGVDEDPD